MNKEKVILIVFGSLIVVLLFLYIASKSVNMAPKDKQLNKEEFITYFNENSKYFEIIAQFALETEGSLNAGLEGRTVLVQDISINTKIIEDEDVVEAVELLMKNSNIVYIGEDESAVWFHTKDIDDIEQGLFYKKRDYDFSYLKEIEEVKENWYYYWTIAMKI